MKLESHLKI